MKLCIGRFLLKYLKKILVCRKSDKNNRNLT